MKPLFELVLRHVAPPMIEDGPFRLLGTIIEANHFLGRIVTGRITLGLGEAEPGGEGARPRRQADRAGPRHQSAGVPRPGAPAIDEAQAGDIVAIAGLPDATVADTICDPSVETPLPAQPIDPPTLSMTFRVNDSPLAGTEGDKVTGRMIRDRLLREAEGNVALRVTESRREGLDGSRRPRRIAARHPDRDDAPRRIRALGVAAQGAAAQATKPASWKSRSKKS